MAIDKIALVGGGNHLGRCPGALPASALTAPLGFSADTLMCRQRLKTGRRPLRWATGFGLHYLVVGDNPHLDADSLEAPGGPLQSMRNPFPQRPECSSAITRTFASLPPLGDTCGYDIILDTLRCKAAENGDGRFLGRLCGRRSGDVLRTLSGALPAASHQGSPRRDVKGEHHRRPPLTAAQTRLFQLATGSINWQRIFAHATQAGAKHIFVEQDRCDVPPLESIKISFDYLKSLRLA